MGDNPVLEMDLILVQDSLSMVKLVFFCRNSMWHNSFSLNNSDIQPTPAQP